MENERATKRSRHPARSTRSALMQGLLGAVVALTFSVAALAADLIRANVDLAQRTTLPGQRSAWVTLAADRGPVPSALALSHLSLVLQRSPERQQAFERLLREQQDPSSPDYHQWLSPTEIGTRFGASRHDIDALAAWLTAQGLRVDAVANSRMRIGFSGTAANVAAAFSTDLHYFQTGAAKRIANTRDVQIPSAFVGAVRSVNGLDNPRFRPTHRARVMQSTLPAKSAPRPADSYCTSSPCVYTVFPADFAQIYDLVPVQQAGIDGSGQTIAVIGRARVYMPDIENFQSLAGLATKDPTFILPTGGVDPGTPASTCSGTSCTNPSDAVGDQGEATLDVQRAGSVAPGATIDLIASANTSSVDGLQVALAYAIDHDPVPARIISLSYATCEAENTQGNAEYLDSEFSQAAMEGISVFVGSGDGGVAGCALLDSPPTAGEQMSTNLLCASGYVTCVGGTEFADSVDPDAYWRPVDSSTFESALGYIPEGAWNEPLDSTGATQTAASGGGVSAYLATPSWQTGAGVPGTQGRYTPDVSFSASMHDAYFSCFAAAGGPCTVAADGGFTYIGAAGTSATAPSMAGIAALLNQKTGSAQANLNSRLYALAANPANGVFHDVTVASSGVSNCLATTPSLCNNSTPGPTGASGGLPGYLVGAGYDEATGLGSIDVANLLAQWSVAQPVSVNLDQRGLTGAWYNAPTSGQGVNIEIDPDFYGVDVGLFYAGWFTYDVTAAGGQRWYTIQGKFDAHDGYVGVPIYLTDGGRFSSPQAATTTPVGDATLQFADCTHGTLTYRFSDGSQREGVIPLTRLTPNVTCTPAGDSGANGGDSWLSGGWADTSELGQGFVFDINPLQPILSAAWYTYTADADPDSGPAAQRWYTLQVAFASGATSKDNIPIYDTTGGVFNNPAPVTSVQVGTADIVFHSCSAATMSYAFTSGENAGARGTLELTRLGAVPIGCRL
jgi:pseudomonalisin